MPNQPDPSKVLVGVRTPRELAAVLTQEAAQHGLKLPGLIVRILQDYVGDPAKRLSRFEREDLAEQTRAARQESGSRRSARSGGERRGGGCELVTGGAQAPVSDAVWGATMESIAPGWVAAEDEDGFSLSCERVPGKVGVCFGAGEYEVYAHYWGKECRAAEFAMPLKWRYGGRRNYGAWSASLREPTLELGLRPIYRGELAAYMRSGKDDALRKLADLMRTLITAMRAYHRRVGWCRAVQAAAETAGWQVQVENWRYMRCCRVERDRQVGEVQLLVYEPIENESLRLLLRVAPQNSGCLRTLLRAMGRRDLAARVQEGGVALEDMDASLTPTGVVDEVCTAERLAARADKWMRRVNDCLSMGLPLESFAALAVETANHDFASVCDLGVVVVRKGRVCKKLRFRVRPEGNEYESLFTEWHGISAADTEHAPDFAEVWAQVAPTLRRLPLVVHTGGTAARLRAALERAGIESPEFEPLQSLKLARHCFPELESHGLHEIAARLGCPISAPGALPKAEACAAIASELYNRPASPETASGE